MCEDKSMGLLCDFEVENNCWFVITFLECGYRK